MEQLEHPEKKQQKPFHQWQRCTSGAEPPPRGGGAKRGANAPPFIPRWGAQGREQCMVGAIDRTGSSRPRTRALPKRSATEWGCFTFRYKAIFKRRRLGWWPLRFSLGYKRFLVYSKAAALLFFALAWLQIIKPSAALLFFCLETTIQY